MFKNENSKEPLNTQSVKDVASIVKVILQDHARARDDDMTLYMFVMNYFGYSKNISFYDVSNLIKAKKIPAIGTVGRSRRKLQEQYPELRGEKYNARLGNTEQFVEFSREGV